MLEKMRAVAIDAVIKLEDEIILVKRRVEPFKERWALPGGRVKLNETVEQAVRREALEETGLEVKVENLVGIYSRPGRDPRGDISIAFLCKAIGGELRAGSDAKEVRKFSKVKASELAFDHAEIIRDSQTIEVLE
jgi:8-oxo-dGTP diphosphatase